VGLLRGARDWHVHSERGRKATATESRPRCVETQREWSGGGWNKGLSSVPLLETLCPIPISDGMEWNHHKLLAEFWMFFVHFFLWICTVDLLYASFYFTHWVWFCCQMILSGSKTHCCSNKHAPLWLDWSHYRMTSLGMRQEITLHGYDWQVCW